MWKEEEYFGDAVVIADCGNCGEEIYRGQDAYYDGDTGEWFCCSDCAKEWIYVTGVIESELVDKECPNCGRELEFDYECVKCEEQYFCDTDCVLNYFDIVPKEAN